ncbi:MAG: phosphoribosylformylglycinamidine synthase subunit PurQ, partial [Dermabacteraceae bacterium]
GMPVLGICNGFQILCETHLLPGAMIKNAHRSFLCRDQPLAVENNRTAWTSGYEAGQVIRIPLKNQDGQYVADERTLAELEGEGRVVFRYAAGATHGPAGFEANPNGSRHDIAGITNAAGNVVGLMPHPEHAVEAGFGPDHPGKGTRSGTDGLAMFTSVLRSMVS